MSDADGTVPELLTSPPERTPCIEVVDPHMARLPAHCIEGR